MSHSTYQLRQATTTDIPALTQLKQQVAGSTYRPHVAAGQLQQWLSHNAGEDHYRYRIGRSGYHVLVVVDDQQEIVGVGTMRIRGSRADMSGLYISRQGQGFGKLLSEAREQLARELGCTQTRASVWRCNQPAQQFVTRRGLQKTGGGFRDQITQIRVDHYERPLA